MPEENISLLLVLDHEYIRHGGEKISNAAAEGLEAENHGSMKGGKTSGRADFRAAEDAEEIEFAAEMGSVFEFISNCCIPLLNMFSSLERGGVPFKISLVITPVLCTLLSDPVVRNQYVAWLDDRIALGRKEVARCAGDKNLLENAKFALEKAEEDRIDFVDIYGRDLLNAFSEWRGRGFVELLGTTGTQIFLPHYSNMEEVLSAQVETGLKAHRYFFGETPEGFWLPEMGYAGGVEKVLRAYGVGYTVLDAQSVIFSETKFDTGIFAPLRFENSLGILARADEADDLIFGPGGYVFRGAYCAKNRDIGFYLNPEELFPLVKAGCPRFSTGYSYWNKSAAGAGGIGDPSGTDVYDIGRAARQCDEDAAHFVGFAAEKLSAAKKILPQERAVSFVCAIDAGRLLEDWKEGVMWLERVLCGISKKQIACRFCAELFADRTLLKKIVPYSGAWCGGGYGENLLSGKNAWMIRHTHKASERMIDLAERFPVDTGIKARLLNMGAKELMLAQSSGWARMIGGHKFSEYAERQFSHFILSFTRVFEALGTNVVSTEWLTRMELSHPIFPWMNYRIFSKKR